jgi:iron complex outermembrane recepter protein
VRRVVWLLVAAALMSRAVHAQEAPAEERGEAASAHGQAESDQDNRAGDATPWDWPPTPAEQVPELEVIPVASVDEPKAVAPEQPRGGRPLHLEEIVVTATKRAEPLREVGGAVSAVTGDSLAKMHAGKFEDFAAHMPGLSFQTEGMGKNQITMRGVTTGLEQSATVGVYVDDVPIGSSSSYASGSNALDLDTYDLDQVEALRGPQGTLYGASAMGGLLKYRTNQPETDGTADLRLEGEGSVTHHGATNYALRGAVGVPFPDAGIGVRLTAYQVRDAGFIDDPSRALERVNSGSKDGVRASVGWDILPEATLRVSAIHQSIKRDGSNAADRDAETGEPVSGEYEQSFVIDQPFEQTIDVYAASLSWDFDAWNLTSATGWQDLYSLFVFDLTRQIGGLAMLGDNSLALEGLTPTTTRKFTQELRFTSGAVDPFSWQAGLFYVLEEGDQGVELLAKGVNLPEPLRNLIGVSPIASALLQAVIEGGLATLTDAVPLAEGNILSDYEEIAAYGSVGYHFTDRFDVTLGLRYSIDEQTFTQRLKGIYYNPTNPTEYSEVSGSSREIVRNYLVNPRFRWNEDTILYARVANGYRPGGPNFVSSRPGNTTPHTFEPDTVWNYEVGVKISFDERRGFLDLSAYHLDWDNIQLFVTTPDLFNAFINGGKAKVDGVETAFSYVFPAGLRLGGSVTYTRPHLAEDAPGVEGHKGDQLPNTARLTGAFTADYAFPPVAGFDLSAGLTYRYAGTRYAGFDGSSVSPQYELRPYSILDMRLGARSSWVNVGLFVKNVLNEEGQLSALVFERQFDSSAPARVSLTLPRTYGLVVGVDF